MPLQRIKHDRYLHPWPVANWFLGRQPELGINLDPSCQSKVREGVDLEELSAVIDVFVLLS
jgi:hypothetical protein